MRQRLETLRGSLFFVPMAYVVAAIALSQASLVADQAISESSWRLPTLLAATVDSARALLSTVAAATITFAGIAFSVSLLTFQLASSQFSPRVLYGLFRDPFSKRVIGVALGTFTFSLLVLRVVRRPLEDGGAPVIPHVSVLIALVLGIIAILAILAFINHSAHSMEAAEIIRRITEETREQIAKICPHPAGEGPKGHVLGSLPEGPPYPVRALDDGWVQDIDESGLLSAAAAGGVVRLDAGTGMFVAAGARLCTIWPSPEDPDAAARAARGAIRRGRTRTMRQDLALGFRQLADIALRALSPGVNDPTTAREAIVHIGSALREILARDLPPRVIKDESERRLFRPHDWTHEDYVDLAFGEIRHAATGHPGVVAVLIEVMGAVASDSEEASPTRAELVRSRAALALEAFELTAAMEADRAMVRKAAEGAGLP
jgi:uncharacterized membrane protein